MTLQGNALLRLLPLEERERLEPRLQRVNIQPGQVIFNSGEPLSHIWFFESGAATRFVQLHSGETVEAGTVGSEGIAGLPLALGGHLGLGQCQVQVAGFALTLSSADFEEHVRNPDHKLMQALTGYAATFIGLLGQLAACHCLHRLEQRIIRCLLTLEDHSGNGSVRITHDALAGFLGVHRPSVTYALQAIAQTGAIALERRRVALLDREALAQSVCECYASMKLQTQRGLNALQTTLSV